MAAAIETSVVWGGDVVTVPLAHPFTVTEARRSRPSWWSLHRWRQRRRHVVNVRLMPPSLAVLEDIRSAGALGPATLIAACSDLALAEAYQLLWPDSETILAALGPLLPPDFLDRLDVTPLADAQIFPPADDLPPEPTTLDPSMIGSGDVETGDPGEIVDFFAEH
ncbi:MAG: hypothetical protein ABS99_00795 [Acetobacteraceae bacterium SCN 69-10]|nr:MAG: hypothetical protein ABS99_00795 [Acetobacteraceae bacterium SCN 69-10]